MARLGQHFLTSEAALKKIIAALDVHDGETILEIGPGHGELTKHLIRLCAKKSCVMIAVEKDEHLASALGEQLNPETIEIVSGDILEMLKPLLSRIKPSFYKIVGNIPYYITGKLLRIISDLDKKPEVCVFTIQKEVAQRIAAKPPDMNKLAAVIQFWAKPTILSILPKTVFKPAPKVESAIIKLTAYKKPDSTANPIHTHHYYQTVGILFRQPRKTIMNNILEGYRQHMFATTCQTVQDARVLLEGVLKTLRIAPAGRPEDLNVEDITRLSQHLHNLA